MEILHLHLVCNSLSLGENLSKSQGSQHIPENFDFYSKKIFPSLFLEIFISIQTNDFPHLRKLKEKGTHKWDEIEVKPEGGGGEKAGGPAVVVDVCHGVRCVCNLGNNFHFFYIFRYDFHIYYIPFILPWALLKIVLDFDAFETLAIIKRCQGFE